MKRPQDYLNLITAAFPCPESGFERAYWLYECREALKYIHQYISEEYLACLDQIEADGTTSDIYEIREVERQISRVNLPLLKKQKPDIFRELVHIKASDAQKILGRSVLYELAREKIGEDAIAEYEAVNVADIERAMLPRLAAGYIEVRSRVIDRIVSEIEPSAAEMEADA